MSEPLVSCLMPTANRRRFVPTAIAQFQAQDYANRELVIVDDGRDAVRDLVPEDDPSVRYIRLEEPVTTGAKRNLTCREARGGILVHWDDDDWFAPWRISYQVDQLLGTGADLCGLSELFFLDIDGNAAWRYRYPERSGRAWVAGGTMAYHRSLWEQTPFPEIRQGEDTRFLWKHAGAKIVPLPRHDFYVAMIHRANTSRKQTSTRRWTRVPVGELHDLMGQATSNQQKPAAVTSPRRTSGGVDTDDHHVVVAIPHFGPPDYLRQAVDSILGQTHRNLTLVVVFDGDNQGLAAIDDITDPRLVRFELGDNHGRYFADQVVLEAMVAGARQLGGFFVVQDSDDWSEPGRIEQLLATTLDESGDVCLSAVLEHNERRVRSTARVRRPRLGGPVTADLVHRAGHQGLYRTDALDRIGGWYAGYRIGFDTSIVNLMMMAGAKILSVDGALYHRRIHGDSLTTSPHSGWGSPARQLAVSRLRNLHEQAFRATLSAGPAQSAEEIRKLVRGGWSDDDRATMQRESKRLLTLLLERRGELGSGPSVGRDRPAAASTRPRPPSVYELIDQGVVDGRDWAISRRGATEIYEHIRRRRPRRILDVGSGTSTLVAAAAAASIGAEVVSLEHDPRFAARTAELLRRFDLHDQVNLTTAPLKQVSHGGRAMPWYDVSLDGTFEFMIVDGPPLPRGGREAVLHEVGPHRGRDWEIWLFDGDRDHEVDCVRRWAGSFRFETRTTALDTTGVTVLTPKRRRSTSRVQPVIPGLGISILSGGRPDLLRRTLGALESRWPDQLDAAYVVAMVNGADDRSVDLLETRGFVDRLIVHDTSVLSIGAATSFLVAMVASQTEVATVLHLEDDWEAVSIDGAILARAAEILDDPEIGQVRLRHRSEPVLGHHMITREPIVWVPRRGYAVADAHFTFNPSLIRAESADRVFPAEDERDAQRRFLATRLRTAQLNPGVFVHTGGQSGGPLSRPGPR